MPYTLKEILESNKVTASAPCRIDMGGTLDISTFYYPLRHLNPSTFNIALDMRTTVRLLPYEKNMVKVTSKGFDEAEYPIDELPFSHPLGLIFAIAAYFRAEGVHIKIESASPPKAALGGSSVAAVALIGAFGALFEKLGISRPLYRREIAILAHALEQSVAGVPCGLQDQLAAAYGGVNLWQWHGRVKEAVFEKNTVIKKSVIKNLEKHILVAYCGKPHDSKDINSQWVKQFLSGKNRHLWSEIIELTGKFADALSSGNHKDAGNCMNMETDIRLKMTPRVLDDTGKELSKAAKNTGCGARFTGAGGGGCVWALGDTGDIDRLKDVWEKILAKKENGRLLNVHIDSDGLILPLL